MKKKTQEKPANQTIVRARVGKGEQKPVVLRVRDVASLEELDSTESEPGVVLRYAPPRKTLTYNVQVYDSDPRA